MFGSNSSLEIKENNDCATHHRRYQARDGRPMKNIRYHKVPAFSSGPDRDILSYAYGSETNLERYASALSLFFLLIKQMHTVRAPLCGLCESE